ncbi:AraC family transcriptional regulator [Portibacter lacus]|uniref:AraC family transcriptional regulator n=1 Tax=Portibacter lacus TaxID=1099794 RepID=A0AA37SR82_9BACT|nr:AraC family transcriptional regulator [Portibacter lacus]GLR18542.1 AraC family transcriptional regulator [Portibacter lacus]
MKSALQKSPIPYTHAFVVKHLKELVFDPTWHFHSEYQLFMVLKGTGTRFIGDSVMTYYPDDITFTGPDLPHLWRSDSDSSSEDGENWSEGIVVYFNEELISENLLQKEEVIKIRKLFKKSLRGVDIQGPVAKTIKKMLINLVSLRGFEGVLELLKILHLISLCSDINVLASAGYTNSLKDGDTERMNIVYAHALKNFKRKLSISEFSTLTNMTPTSFSRYFKTHANKTFSDFLIEIRIGHACKLLIENKVNISQACYDSGFQTLSNFNRQFKKITNRTPLEYRKEYVQ